MRRDPDGKVRRYAHLGTGNYNPSTARFYTDLSLLTSDPQITEAVHYVFNFLTAYSERASYGPLSVAPLNLGKNCVSLIDREAAHAKAGRPALIVAKVNSLLDKNIIHALYRASQAGVHVELIVRGACALRPGRSRRQQPHPRAQRGGAFPRAQPHLRLRQWRRTEVYLGSADWMPRNLYERVEVIFRLKDPAAVPEGLLGDSAALFRRHRKGPVSFVQRPIRAQAAASELVRPTNGTRFNVQEFFMDIAEDAAGLIAPLPAAVLENLHNSPRLPGAHDRMGLARDGPGRKSSWKNSTSLTRGNARASASSKAVAKVTRSACFNEKQRLTLSWTVSADSSCWLRPHHQYRARGQPHHFLGHRPKRQLPPAGHSMRGR